MARSAAKKSLIAKQAQREKVVARFAARRAELKERLRLETDPEAVAALVRTLSRMPRDASATRLRRRDAVDGRPRGHLCKFGISRVRLREMAHNGELPGVTTSSW